MTTLWDTTGTAIVNELAAQRRTGGAVISGVALTLVVVADEPRVAEAEEAAAVAAAQHPCRILVVVRRQIDAPAPRLDAEVLVGGRLGPGEAVVMRMYGRLGLHAESVVVPLLAADVPVVTWWHTPPPQKLATDALAVIADRRITDCARAEDPLAALRARADDYAPGDTDLTWTRSTPWRAILTSTLDAASARRREPLRLLGGRIEGDPNNATAALVSGWLSWRCGCAIEVVGDRRATGSSGLDAVTLHLDDNEALRIRTDHRGSAVITQSFRAGSTVTLPERRLGDLLGEELRRLDADEPYSQALEVATGRTGLASRSPVRQHIWVEPTQRTDKHKDTAGEPDLPDRNGGGSTTRRPPRAGAGSAGNADETAARRDQDPREEEPVHR
ncbi:glucose-6-phosphate dehydrogenase assembly protein OpcA [Geodermatophilus sp. DSM 44513]|uniref:glucose-6-phosphate dehydrogenase assembly protein OpcA n=1 Tax=Geodermatophilus sp. DSM 44513 TaxID=1528104 RepID=UPI001280E259|nr:glucose-6-phosphate dehydrogenase assembly protein OpcA [Geodermatophilus sp. DSM 44513]WNV75222.1 glucose-6-phosphate dehydrogenase assembly protein OpcA [Geodermatophilus sp. DSM 44513]